MRCIHSVFILLTGQVVVFYESNNGDVILLVEKWNYFGYIFVDIKTDEVFWNHFLRQRIECYTEATSYFFLWFYFHLHGKHSPWIPSWIA